MPTATARESAAKPSRKPVLSFGRTAGLLAVIARLPIGDGSSCFDEIITALELGARHLKRFER